MLKFFRRYRNWVLAVGGSVLMVAFLLGSALSQLKNITPSPTIAQITIKGKIHKIKDKDRQRAGMELEMFKRAFGNMLDNLIDPLHEYDDNDPDKKPLDDPIHWYLLKEQAIEAGLMGGVGDARNWLTQQAGFIVQSNPSYNGNVDLAYQQLLQNMANGANGRLNERDILLAVADFLAVQRLMTSYHSSSLPADYRIQQFGNLFLNSVIVRALLVDASNFIDNEVEPTDDAIEQHYKKYRDIEPGEGEYGLGYRLPDRAKFEYIKIDYQSVLDQVKATGLDARLWYEKNKDSIQRLPGKTEPPTYDQVADAALDAYKRDKVDLEIDRIINAVKAKLLRSTRSLKRDGDYRDLPADWISKRLSFTDLRQSIQDEFGVTVTYKAIGDHWVDIKTPTDVGDIAFAQRPAGSQLMRLSQVLESYREFGNPQIAGLQEGLADVVPFRASDFRPILGRNNRAGNLTDVFFMRVTAIDPARPPKSVDEVRTEIVRDLKRIAAFNRLKTQQEDWLKRVNTEGLEELTKSLSARTMGGRITRLDLGALSTGEGFAPARIFGIGRNKNLMNAILEKAASISENGEVIVGDVTDLPADKRTVVSPIPEKLGLAIARIDTITPITQGALLSVVNRSVTFKKSDTVTAKYGFADLYAAYELNNKTPGINPFSFEALKKHYLYVSKRDESADIPDEGLTGKNETDNQTNEDQPTGN